MASKAIACLLLVCWTRLIACYVQLDFNTSHYYGPDGPWQAVNLKVGYHGLSWHPINVYPAFLREQAAIFAPTSEACVGYDYADCSSGGISPPPSSNSFDPGHWSFSAGRSNYSFSYAGNRTIMKSKVREDFITVPQASVVVANKAVYQYPSGVELATEVGLGGLGGGWNASNFYHDTSFSSFLEVTSNADSDSFGLHLGIAQAGYDGSLVYGGYDKGRVIGRATSYLPNSVIQLQDIVIDVETGSSPFGFPRKSGLLSGNPDVSEAKYTYIAPEVPYIFLPNETIHSIIHGLPIHFDHESGYYLWDQGNPQYKKIVSSPAYLGFIFTNPDGTTGPLTIKVPFALLNLTLDGVVTGRSRSEPYFPLMPSPKENLRQWMTGGQFFHVFLGRAFLQAAFIGANWQRSKVRLAQAPGPNGISSVGSTLKSIERDQEVLEPGSMASDAFAESWKGHWIPLEDELSKGTFAGIVIGVIAFVAILVSAVFWLRRRRQRQREWPEPVAPYDTPLQKVGELKASTARRELHQEIPELRGADLRRELPGSYHPSELPGSQPQPQELPVPT